MADLPPSLDTRGTSMPATAATTAATSNSVQPPTVSSRPPPQPVMPRPDVAHDLERKKNEIVQEMLQRIRPLLGPQGHLRPDTDFDAFAALMVGETHFVQRTLLLTVLQSAGSLPEASAIFRSMGSSSKLVGVLSDWLGESVKQDSPLLAKLLEIYQRLPLSVDQLVEHRLGKLVKRLVANEAIKVDVKERAAQLCDEWTRLARQEDATRRTGVEGPDAGAGAAPSKGSTLQQRRRSEGGNIQQQTGSVVANMTFFNDTAPSAPPPPPLKSRAEQILERVARGETSKVTTRPLSADDIHKAKKRKQYLQEATREGINTSTTHADPAVAPDHAHADPAVASDHAHADPAKRKGKRVSFANDEELVQVRLFDPPEDDYYQVDDSNAHEMERNEASFAFKQMALVMEAERDWEVPKQLELPPTAPFSPGARSEETSIQEAREQRALSAVYFSPDDIPPSPTEWAVEGEEGGTAGSPAPSAAPKRIPLKDAEGRVSTIVRHVEPPLPKARPLALTTALLGRAQSPPPLPPPPSSLSAAAGVNSDLLSALLKDPNALQDILRNVPPPATTAAPTAVGRPPPRSHPRPPPPPPPPLLPFPMPNPSAMANSPRLAASMMFARPPPLPGMPPHHLPFPMPPRPMAFPPMMPPLPMPFPPPALAGARPPPGKSICKYYRRGRPGSCRYGTSCQFYHAEQ